MTIQKVVRGNVIQFDSADWGIVDPLRFRIHPKDKSVMSHYYKNGKTKTIYLSRVLMGVDNPKILVDHINRNPLDNRRSNLRIASFTQNNYNKSKHRGKSKYKGVLMGIDRGRPYLYARIVVNKKCIHLGSYKTQEEAALAYNEAAKKYHGEFAVLNLVP